MRKICIVSGGSGGLGLAIAGLLVKAGKDVLILGRNSEKLSRAVKSLNRIRGTRTYQYYGVQCRQ